MAKRKRYYDDRRSSGMISEDYSAPSNLPQNVVYKEYPRVEYDFYDLNDNITGIDVQMNDDVRHERRKKGMKYPEKY